MKIKIPKRGGTRRKSANTKDRLLDSRRFVLEKLMEYYGGRKAIANYIEEHGGEAIHPQNFINWRRRGRVPLEQVEWLADVLGVDPFILNYRDMSQHDRLVAPDWEKLIKGAKFLSAEDKSKALSL